MLIAVPQKRILPHLKRLGRCFSSALPDDEYTNTPQYPKILDLSHKERLKRKKLSEHDAIKAVKTVEEKQIKLNMPRYYGFKRYVFHEDKINFNALPLVQHITRTHLIESDDLPGFYSDVNVDLFCERIKNQAEEAILLEYEGYKRKVELLGQEKTIEEQDNSFASSVVQLLNRVILSALSENYPHLKTAQVSIS